MRDFPPRPVEAARRPAPERGLDPEIHDDRKRDRGDDDAPLVGKQERPGHHELEEDDDRPVDEVERIGDQADTDRQPIVEQPSEPARPTREDDQAGADAGHHRGQAGKGRFIGVDENCVKDQRDAGKQQDLA